MRAEAEAEGTAMKERMLAEARAQIEEEAAASAKALQERLQGKLSLYFQPQHRFAADW